MPDFLKIYGDTEGPLGFPMRDHQAISLDAVLRGLPKTPEYEYRRCVVEKAASEVVAGERADISWITTESPDRANEVVLSKGMNDSQFALNPLVTLGHCYWSQPVGKSLWRKKVIDADRRGIKAKTKYAQKRDNWPDNEYGNATPWLPDKAFALVQAGVLSGKSIGFLPLKGHVPDEKEYAKAGWKPGEVRHVYDEWMLLEYACCYLPCNHEAIVEQVSKGDVPDELLAALGLDRADLVTRQAPAIARPFTTEAEVLRAVDLALAAIDLPALVRRQLQVAYDEHTGRV